MENSYIPHPDGLVLYTRCGRDMPSMNSSPKMANANFAEKLTNQSIWTNCQNQKIKTEIGIKLTHT